MEYQEKYELLLEEKQKVELEFGLARRRFKELYLGCENQFNNEKETSRQLEIQVQELTRQVDEVKSEIEGVRIAAKISEEAKQEEYANLNAKHQEELASMQHIWKEASYDSQNRLVTEFEEERKILLDANSKLEQKIRQMDDGSNTTSRGNNDGIVSMMGNVFTSKKSPNIKGMDTSPLALENSQQQVQQDIDAWKSVVQPLEVEIDSLKKQLTEATLQIKSKNLKDPVSAGKKSDKEFMLNEELKEAQKYFESEKSARTDLEMYVAVLNTQKGVLQEDSDKLKRELHNVCRLFEQEKMSHNELKQTWKLANDQFLTQQQNILIELESTKNILTPSQLEEISKNNFSDKSNAIKTVAEHPYQVSTSKHDEQMNKDVKAGENLIDFDCGEFNELVKQSSSNIDKKAPKGGAITQKTDKLTDSIFNTFFPAAYQARQFNELLMEDANVKEQPLILSSSSDSEDDDLEHAIRIQNLNRYGLEEGEEMHESSSPSAGVLNAKTNPVAILEDFDNEMKLKKSTSTDDILHPVTPETKSLEKSLSQGDISWSSNTVEISHDDKEDVRLGKDKSIWNNVSVEYAHTCMMCQNYEKQLQRLQKDYMSIKEREVNQLDNIKSLQYQLNSEKENVASLEKSIENVSSDNRTQLCIHEKNQEEVDKQVLLLQTQFDEFQMNILHEMKSLNGELITES